MQKEGMKKAINILTVLCTAAMAAFVIYGVKSGIFTDRVMMEELVRKGGWYRWLFRLFREESHVQ